MDTVQGLLAFRLKNKFKNTRTRSEDTRPQNSYKKQRTEARGGGPPETPATRCHNRHDIMTFEQKLGELLSLEDANDDGGCSCC